MRFVSPDFVAAGFEAANEDLVYANTADRGFLLVDLTHEVSSNSSERSTHAYIPPAPRWNAWAFDPIADR